MSPLQSGDYTITNVRFQNIAILPDENHETDIVSEAEVANGGERWSVSLLPNRKYTIKNLGFTASHAGCSTSVEKGDNVAGRRGQRVQQWIIKETRNKGRFVISPTFEDLFWGLVDGEMKTPITLEGSPNSTKNQWTFTKIST